MTVDDAGIPPFWRRSPSGITPLPKHRSCEARQLKTQERIPGPSPVPFSSASPCNHPRSALLRYLRIHSLLTRPGRCLPIYPYMLFQCISCEADGHRQSEPQQCRQTPRFQGRRFHRRVWYASIHPLHIITTYSRQLSCPVPSLHNKPVWP